MREYWDGEAEKRYFQEVCPGSKTDESSKKKLTRTDKRRAIRELQRQLAAWDGVPQIEAQTLVEPVEKPAGRRVLSVGKRVGIIAATGMVTLLGCEEAAQQSRITNFPHVEQSIYDGLYNLKEVISEHLPGMGVHVAPLEPSSAGQPDVASFTVRAADDNDHSPTWK